MTSYIHRPGHPFANDRGLVEKSVYYQYKYLTEPNSDKRAVIGNQVIELNFISDSQNDTWHPANGKYYSSKSEFRKVTKQHGCIEVGNETKTLTKPRKYQAPSKKQRREDIKKAIYDIRNGYNTFKDTPHENIFKQR